MTANALQALAWKEWREHQMRIVACCVVMGVAAAVGLQPSSRSAEAMLPTLMFIAALVLPLFVAMALGLERHHGQLATLVVQPVPAVAIFAVKTLFGCVTVIAPVLTVALIARLVMNERAYAAQHVPVSTLYASLAAVVTFIWMISLGARGANEVRVGIAAVAVLGLWLGGLVAYVFIIEMFYRRSINPSGDPLVTANPLYFLATALNTGRHVESAWWNLPAAGLLWAWGAWTFGALPARTPEAPAPQRNGFGIISRRHPIAALLWKEWRLNRVWLATGLTLLVVFPIAVLLIDLPTSNRITRAEFIEFLAAMMVSCLPILTILIAVTTFSRELQPSAFELLQAQPISSGRWFLVKYAGGLLTALLVVAAPFLLLVLVANLAWHGEHVFQQDFEDFAASSIPLTWIVLLYSLAAFLAAFIPQPIFAGILSLGAALMLWALSFYESLRWLDVAGAINEPGWDTLGGAVANWLAYGLPLLGIATGAACLAWWIVRWNWWTEPVSINPRLREQAT